MCFIDIRRRLNVNRAPSIPLLRSFWRAGRAALPALKSETKGAYVNSALSKEFAFVDSQHGMEFAHAIIDTVRGLLVALDQGLCVIDASRSFCKIFNLVRKGVRDKLLYEIDGGVGLIVTELVMNALKHAFRGEKWDAVIVVSYKVARTDWKRTVSNGLECRT